jgi:hypothetical protein
MEGAWANSLFQFLFSRPTPWANLKGGGHTTCALLGSDYAKLMKTGKKPYKCKIIDFVSNGIVGYVPAFYHFLSTNVPHDNFCHQGRDTQKLPMIETY